MPPDKQPISCGESSYCLVPALKESIEKAERFNQEYRRDVKSTLEGIQTNTGQIATYLANQEALKETVGEMKESLGNAWIEIRTKPSRKELVSFLAGASAVIVAAITVISFLINYYS